jgi:hypothetical protein
MCAECNELAEKFETLDTKLNILNERQFFLKESLKELAVNGIQTNIQKIDIQEHDTVVFNLPDEMTYDQDFFDAILPIFKDKNVSVIALHAGITINVLRKGESNGT